MSLIISGGILVVLMVILPTPVGAFKGVEDYGWLACLCMTGIVFILTCLVYSVLIGKLDIHDILFYYAWRLAFLIVFFHILKWLYLKLMHGGD